MTATMPSTRKMLPESTEEVMVVIVSEMLENETSLKIERYWIVTQLFYLRENFPQSYIAILCSVARAMRLPVSQVGLTHYGYYHN